MTMFQRRTIISVSFAAFWLCILYTGADHPPPVGFLLLIPLVLLCAAVVYWRLPDYVAWSKQRTPKRLIRVAFDGLAVGLIIGVVTSLSTHWDSPAVSWNDSVIWFCVLAVVGLLNALAVYAIAVIVDRASSAGT